MHACARAGSLQLGNASPFTAPPSLPPVLLAAKPPAPQLTLAPVAPGGALVAGAPFQWLGLLLTPHAASASPFYHLRVSLSTPEMQALRVRDHPPPPPPPSSSTAGAHALPPPGGSGGGAAAAAVLGGSAGGAGERYARASLGFGDDPLMMTVAAGGGGVFGSMLGGGSDSGGFLGASVTPAGTMLGSRGGLESAGPLVGGGGGGMVTDGGFGFGTVALHKEGFGGGQGGGVPSCRAQVRGSPTPRAATPGFLFLEGVFFSRRRPRQLRRVLCVLCVELPIGPFAGAAGAAQHG